MLIGNTNEVLIPYFVFTTPSHQPHHTEPLILVGMQLAVTTDQVRSPSVTLLIMTMVMLFVKMLLMAGLHKLWYPVVRDRSTWSKFGAHGEHGDVFLFSNLGAL